MLLELDHVFVAASAGGPEMEALNAAGFQEGPAHDHPGQGTASRGIFFENAYLELLWLTDADAAAVPPVRRTGLLRRADPRQRVSPFGFGLRSPLEPVPDLPFETWEYCPAYLPRGWAILMAGNSENLDEPLIFLLPWSRSPVWEMPEHANGVQRLTKVGLTLGISTCSPELSAFWGLGLIAREEGSEPLLRLEFDQRTRGEHLDLRPRLPLVLDW